MAVWPRPCLERPLLRRLDGILLDFMCNTIPSQDLMLMHSRSVDILSRLSQ